MKNILLILLVVILGFWLPKKMKKAILIILAVAAGLCLIGAAGVGIFLATLPDDIPSFDDSQLVRPKESLPDEQNAFTYYAQAADVLACPEDREAFDRIFDGEDWNEDLVEGVLDQNKPVFQLVAAGNRRERCLAPRVTSIDSLMPYLAKWRAIARLLVVQTQYDIRQAEASAALADVKTLCEFSHRIQADASCLIHYVVAVAIREMSMRSTRDLVNANLLSQGQLEELQEILEKNQPSIEGYIHAWQSEYEVFANFVDSLHTGERIIDDDPSSKMPEWIQRGAAKYFLHPNRTKRDMGMIYSELIKQATNFYANTRVTDVDEFMLSKKKAIDEAEGFAKFRVPNPVGTLLYPMLLPASQTVVKQKCNTAVSHRATTILIALDRYRMTHDRLPSELASLVPQFLSAVPRDPYDGKPMRYVPDAGIVYSVGEDLKDSASSVELSSDREPRNAWQCQWMTEDIVFQIDERIKQTESTVPSKASPSTASDVR
ncbi:MAG: hypothetical protein ACOC6C_02875 [Verrucomicrobiota bacterium]